MLTHPASPHISVSTQQHSASKSIQFKSWDCSSRKGFLQEGVKTARKDNPGGTPHKRRPGAKLLILLSFPTLRGEPNGVAPRQTWLADVLGVACTIPSVETRSHFTQKSRSQPHFQKQSPGDAGWAPQPNGWDWVNCPHERRSTCSPRALVPSSLLTRWTWPHESS